MIKVGSGLAVVLAVAMFGCSLGPENEAATAKCRNAGTSDACGDCCSKNGVSRSVFTNVGSGTKCSCRDKKP